MDKLKKLSKEVPIVKDKIRAKFKKQGLNEIQIETKLNTLDCEFCTHVFVNDTTSKYKTAEERLKFYVDFLKREL